MHIGQKNGQLAARPQQLGELYGRHKISAVWSSSSRAAVKWWKLGIHVVPRERRKCESADSRSPVDFWILALVDDVLNHVEIKPFGEVLLDQSDPLFSGHLRHVGRCW